MIEERKSHRLSVYCVIVLAMIARCDVTCSNLLFSIARVFLLLTNSRHVPPSPEDIFLLSLSVAPSTNFRDTALFIVG